VGAGTSAGAADAGLGVSVVDGAGVGAADAVVGGSGAGPGSPVPDAPARAGALAVAEGGGAARTSAFVVPERVAKAKRPRTTRNTSALPTAVAMSLPRRRLGRARTSDAVTTEG